MTLLIPPVVRTNPDAITIKSVAVVGATGNVGRSVVTALADAGFTVAALSRSASKKASFPADVTLKQTDYSEESLLSAFEDQDAVVSTISTGGIQQQRLIIDAAIKAGVKRFIPSEFGMDTADPLSNRRVPEVAHKAAVIKYLKTKQRSMSWTAVCAGAVFDWSIAKNELGWSVPDSTAQIFSGGDVPVSFTNLGQIGRAVAYILTRPKDTANQYIYIDSFVATQNQVLGVLEQMTGRKWKTEQLDAEEVWKEGMEQSKSMDEAQKGAGTLQTVMATLYGQLGLGYFGLKTAHWRTILELPQEELEESVRRGLNAGEGNLVL